LKITKNKKTKENIYKKSFLYRAFLIFREKIRAIIQTIVRKTLDLLF